MKKLVAFVLDLRINAMLCCGATVLLCACNAGVSDPVNGQQSQTVAALGSSAGQSAASRAPAPYGAEAALQSADAAAAADAGATTAAATTTASSARTATTATTAASATPPAGAANVEPAYDSSRQAAMNAGFSNQTDETEAAAAAAAANAPAADNAQASNIPAACDTGACPH